MKVLLKSSGILNEDEINRISFIGFESITNIEELANIVSIIDIGLISFNYNEVSIMSFYLHYEVFFLFAYIVVIIYSRNLSYT